MAGVRVEGVSKRFGKTAALDDVSFACEDGEFFTLFGPSGAGKTTMLELIAGIKKSNAGQIFIGEACVDGMPLQERDVAMAFENYALYPHMTVEGNIAFPLHSPRAKKRTETEIKARAQEAADQLGIGHLLDRHPSQLSGGQKQRVSLARALVREPEVFLLDEPIAHLDAKLRTAARANLKDIAHRLGATIIYVTHDYREALGLSDRICILREGSVEQIGEPRAIYKQPASDFVAHLIGDPVTNLIDGEIRSEGGDLLFQTEKLSLRLSEQSRARLGDRQNGCVRLGIRPRDVKAHPSVCEGATPMNVFGVERSAHSALIHADLGPCMLTAEAPLDATPGVGERVWMAFDLSQAHFFDKTFELTR